jgi:hypothetical protein
MMRRTVVPFTHQQLLAKRHSITSQNTWILHLPQHWCKNVTHHRFFQGQEYKRVTSHIMQAVSSICNIWTPCYADRHPFNSTEVKVKVTLSSRTYRSSHSKPQHELEVRGQLHGPAAPTPVTELPVPTGWTPQLFSMFRVKNLLTRLGIELRIIQPVP